MVHIHPHNTALRSAASVCAFMLLVEWNGSMNENYELYVLANGLNETAQAILLIGVLFSVLIEDVSI